MRTCRIYPPWEILNQLHNPLTEGERALLEFLDASLPPDWFIFAQPHLNGTRPDVIIFKPNVGAIIYEVKDWQLRAYSFEGGNLYVHDSRGECPIKNPVSQVNHYKRKIIEQLLPLIGEAVDNNPSAFGVIKVGLYFHHETTQAVKKFFKGYVQPYTPIFGYDFLHQKHLCEVVPDLNIKSSLYWRKTWNDELLFWLNPPYHSVEQTTPLELTKQQQSHAEPQSGHFRLRGVVGSGKTQVIAYRAAKLASMGKKVLILTFNITLWHYIRDMIQRAPFEFSWSDITLKHFHEFCQDILNNYGYDWPKGEGEEFFKSVIVNKVREAIQRQSYDKWDAILIDEGQDYYWEWYNLLCEFLTERDELLLVCDKRQNIYQRELSWIDEGMINVKFRGRWRELKTVFRLPRRIAEHAIRFGQMFTLDQEIEIEDIIQLSLLGRAIDPHILWLEIKANEWLGYIWGAFKFLKSQQMSPSDTVILLPTHSMGIECVNHFAKYNIQVNHLFENTNAAKIPGHKKSFWNGDSRLKMSTIHSFKGWEALHVILYISEQKKFSTRQLDSIVYTAITRTRENLIVLNTNARYREFGKKLPSKWSEQEITTMLPVTTAPSKPVKDKIEGKIEWYNQNKRYGVIRGEDSTSYFIHFSNLIAPEYLLDPGTRVCFLFRSRKHGKSGLEAYKVELLKS